MKCPEKLSFIKKKKLLKQAPYGEGFKESYKAPIMPYQGFASVCNRKKIGFRVRKQERKKKRLESLHR